MHDKFYNLRHQGTKAQKFIHLTMLFGVLVFLWLCISVDLASSSIRGNILLTIRKIH
jgi:hypothetical protein